MPVTSFDVMYYDDVTGNWGEIIVSDGGFGPFSAHSIFSTLKHGVYMGRHGVWLVVRRMESKKVIIYEVFKVFDRVHARLTCGI